MPFVSKYFVHEYFGEPELARFSADYSSDSGELGMRVPTTGVKNMTQTTRVRGKNMTQATRLFSENMTQPTRDLFRFTLLIHRSARRKDGRLDDPYPKVR
jgi:hypothetical protein